VPRYRAAAEFRRQTTTSGWVLAGVLIDHQFTPAVPGVEPVRWRLPTTGLQGWTDLPLPIIAADPAAAAQAALDQARDTWPDRVRPEVPHAAGGVGS
jgi:hypothetical protein